MTDRVDHESRWVLRYTVDEEAANNLARVCGGLPTPEVCGTVDCGRRIKSVSFDELRRITVVGPEINWTSPPVLAWRLEPYES